MLPQNAMEGKPKNKGATKLIKNTHREESTKPANEKTSFVVLGP